MEGGKGKQEVAERRVLKRVMNFHMRNMRCVVRVTHTSWDVNVHAFRMWSVRLG